MILATLRNPGQWPPLPEERLLLLILLRQDTTLYIARIGMEWRDRLVFLNLGGGQFASATYICQYTILLELIFFFSLRYTFFLCCRICSSERCLRYNPVKCGRIVTACAGLHNMCILGGVENYDPPPHVYLRNRFAREEYAPGECLNAARNVRHAVVQELERRRNERR